MAEQTATIQQTQEQSKVSHFENFLLERKFLTKDALLKARVESITSHRNLFDYLVAERLLTEEQLTAARGLFFNLPYIDLRSKTIPKEVLDIASKDTLYNYKFVPFELKNSVLKVALADPTDIGALEALEFLATKRKYKMELFITSYSSFQAVLHKGDSLTKEVSEALSEAVLKEKEEKKKAPKEAVEEKITDEAPIAKIVDVIIKHAIDGRASDIHIEPSEEDLRIRYRIDGILHSSLILPKTVHAAIISRIKILSNLKIDEQRLPQDGRFHTGMEGKSIDFRVSTFPTVVGEKVVLRILDKSGGAPQLEELGLSGRSLNIVQESIKKPHGMFLITGPTGSGKSTTLYAILSILNKPGVNIVTLEDPVEYFIDGVNQAQIKPEIGLTFASGLRSILRQDPNIIMVGEIRDRETAELAVNSALTGHLVFSTLHTNNAVGAIPRLIDMGVEPFLLTASLNLLAGQRLVRRICDKCKAEAAPTDAIEKLIREEIANVNKDELKGLDLKHIKLFYGRGCPVCNNTGFRGRVAIYEILNVSKEIQNLINERSPALKIQEYAIAEEGLILMRQDGILKALRGLTTVEEVIRATKE
ncbi:MAG: type II/IV secretion system protein [Candidatus Doudnabacteria bacterium]|nr:type II/IV secretion system protein [Candidatus Doudnabacteria bacterium]